MADEFKVDFTRIFRAFIKRKQAVVRAAPYTAALVARARSFILHQGMLAYEFGNKIRLLDTIHAKGTEIVVDCAKLIPEMLDEAYPIEILHYAEGILSFLVMEPHGRTLYVVDVPNAQLLLRHGSSPRMSRHLAFVRNNSEYLVYGTKSELSANRLFRRWALRVFNIRTRSWDPTKRVLTWIVGSQIGRTIDFRIFDDYFYAASSRGIAEVEGVYGVHSAYHVVRFPLDRPTISHVEETNPEDMFRRGFDEGAIDDRWNRIFLERDDITGNLMVCEQRREWLADDTYQNSRTMYRQKVVFRSKNEKHSSKDEKLAESPSASSAKTPSPTLPDAGVMAPLSTMLSPQAGSWVANTYIGMAPAPHLQADGASNLSGDDDNADNADVLVCPPFFLRVRTIHSLSEAENTSRGSARQYHTSEIDLRQYDTSSNAFLDIVHHEPPDASFDTSRPWLRFRSIYSDTFGAAGITNDSDIPACPPASAATRTDGKNTSVWPRTAPDAYSPKDLHNLMGILNPPTQGVHRLDAKYDPAYGTVAYACERISERTESGRWLVLVSFDPRVRLHGLRNWHERDSLPLAKRAATSSEASHTVDVSESPSPPLIPAPKTISVINEFMITERALYLSIAIAPEEKGFTSFGYNFSR
jgi:hypothetical protein